MAEIEHKPCKFVATGKRYIWMANILGAFIFITIGWSSNKIFEHETRISKIEGFTGNAKLDSLLVLAAQQKEEMIIVLKSTKDLLIENVKIIKELKKK
jgi:hypothetical protein